MPEEEEKSLYPILPDNKLTKKKKTCKNEYNLEDEQKTNSPKKESKYDEEPLLQDNPNRFVLFPIQYPDIWKAYKKHSAAFWQQHEVDFTNDHKDWVKLSDNEKHFVKYVLAFFAGSDGIVAENLISRFTTEIQIPEVRCFYGFQNAIENVHSEVYSTMIETYIKDPDEKKKLFNAIDNIPCVAKKAEWAIKWMGSKSSFAERLVAFACVEGIFFSGSFCCIFWLRSQNKLPGLCTANDWIARDEGWHTDFACLLYNNYVKNRLTQKRMEEIVKEAMLIETEFITKSLPCSLLGMNKEKMSEYIKYIANRLVLQLGHSEIYPKAQMPFKFMENISMDNKTNFFEERVTEYQSSSGNNGDEKNNFDFGSDIEDLDF